MDSNSQLARTWARTLARRPAPALELAPTLAQHRYVATHQPRLICARRSHEAPKPPLEREPRQTDKRTDHSAVEQKPEASPLSYAYTYASHRRYARKKSHRSSGHREGGWWISLSVSARLRVRSIAARGASSDNPCHPADSPVAGLSATTARAFRCAAPAALARSSQPTAANGE